MIEIGNLFSNLNRKMFFILNRDNDNCNVYCVFNNKGGWWFSCCCNVYLNGFYNMFSWYKFWYFLFKIVDMIQKILMMVRWRQMGSNYFGKCNNRIRYGKIDLYGDSW